MNVSGINVMVLTPLAVFLSVNVATYSMVYALNNEKQFSNGFKKIDWTVLLPK